MYAVIETGGKQYQVKEGDVVFVEKLDCEVDQTVSFDKVVAVGTDNGLKIGTPYVSGATVEAKVLKNGKSKRLRYLPINQRRVQRENKVIDSTILQ